MSPDANGEEGHITIREVRGDGLPICGVPRPSSSYSCLRVVGHLGEHRSYLSSRSYACWDGPTGPVRQLPLPMPPDDANPCPRCGEEMFPIPVPTAEGDDTSVLGHDCDPSRRSDECPLCGEAMEPNQEDGAYACPFCGAGGPEPIVAATPFEEAMAASRNAADQPCDDPSPRLSWPSQCECGWLIEEHPHLVGFRCDDCGDIVRTLVDLPNHHSVWRPVYARISDGPHG